MLTFNTLPDRPFSKIAEFSGHTSAVYKMVKVSETEFFSGSGDGKVVKWSIEEVGSGFLIAQLPLPIFTLNVQNNRLIAGGQCSDLYQIDLLTGRNKTIKLDKVNNIYIIQIDDSGNLLVGTDEGILYLIDLESFEIIISIKISQKPIRTIEMLSADFYAIGDSSGFVKIVNTKTMEVVNQLKVNDFGISNILYVQNRLILGTKDGKLFSFNLSNDYQFKLECRQEAHSSSIYRILSFGMTTNMLITASRDKTIRFWNLDNLQPITSIKGVMDSGHSFSVNDMIYYPHQNILVSAGDDKKIILWQIDVEHLQLLLD